jgi:prephenate dehydrogenase
MSYTSSGPIGIIGLGLIGGSLAKALVRLEIPVCGYDIDSTTQECAKADGINVVDSIDSLIETSDIVIIATPQRMQIQVAEYVAHNCGKELLISDVGSVKRPFQAVSSKYLEKSNIHWVGLHPLAGTEHSGYMNSNPDLFSNAVWAVSLDSQTRIRDYLLISEIIFNLGGKVLPLSPEVHDDSVARISHFPYIVAALVAGLAGESEYARLTLNMAAGSFRDCTRVAASDPDFSVDLSLWNWDNVIGITERAVSILQGLYDPLKYQDTKYLHDFYARGQHIRRMYCFVNCNRSENTISLVDSRIAIKSLLELGRTGNLIIQHIIVDRDYLKVISEINE